MNQNNYKEYPDWTTSEKKEVYEAVFAQVYDYDRSVGTVVSGGTLRGMRTYAGRGISSLHTSGYMSDIDVNGQLNVSASMTKSSFNLTASCIDTLSAKLASIEAVPQAVTSKGNVKGRKLAEDLNHLLKGIFHKYQISHLINLAYRDAMINKAGYLKIIKTENDEIEIDRVLVDEVIIDPADGYYNNPYKMLHRKAIPVSVMIEKYPQHEVKIRECKVNTVSQIQSINYTPTINVIEGWCKNTYKEKGRHVLCIETLDILDEEWDKDYFPIVKMDYNEPVVGWLGVSVVDELDSIQKEIDRILMTIQAIMKIVSVPRIFYDNNAGVNLNHLTNKIGICVGYDGKNGVAPIIHNGAGMPPELPQQLQTMIELGYSRVGLTPMDTQGQQKTGSGNQSGEALKTMTDIKSERWQLLQHNYEESHVEVASIILKELQGTNIRVSALDRQIGLREISTKKIPKTDDSYVLKIFPVSSLPDSIPDLIDSVERMMQLGVIQPSQVPDLFKMPDLDTYISLQSAPRKLIDKKIEEMLDGGKYWNPEPYHDLDYALSCALQHYNWAQLNDVSDKIIKNIRTFINDVKTLKAQALPPAPAGVVPTGPVDQQTAPIAPQQ